MNENKEATFGLGPFLVLERDGIWNKAVLCLKTLMTANAGSGQARLNLD